MENLKNAIIALAMLKGEGKKIAFVKGNRSIKEKNFVSKMKSMVDFGQLLPAVIMLAVDVVNAGLEIVDAETGKSVPKDALESYVVLLDGQHRYMAYLQNEEAGKTEQGEFYMMFPLNENVPPQDILSEINIQTKLWDTGDYLKALLLTAREKNLPLLEFLAELMDLGMQISTAQRWGCFKYMGINTAMLAEAVKGEVNKALTHDSNLEHGRRLWKTANKVFSIKTLKLRYFIDFFIEKYDVVDRNGLWERFEEFISTMDSADVEFIENVKGEKGGRSKEEKIVAKLNALYIAKYGEN